MFNPSPLLVKRCGRESDSSVTFAARRGRRNRCLYSAWQLQTRSVTKPKAGVVMQASRRHEFYRGQKEFHSTLGADQKNCALLAGFKLPFRFSHMNGTKQQRQDSQNRSQPSNKQNDKLKEGNDSHEDTDHFSESTSHDSPFAVHSRSRRAYAWCVCTRVGPDGFRSCSATGRRLSQLKHRRGGFCAF